MVKSITELLNLRLAKLERIAELENVIAKSKIQIEEMNEQIDELEREAETQLNDLSVSVSAFMV